MEKFNLNLGGQFNDGKMYISVDDLVFYLKHHDLYGKFDSYDAAAKSLIQLMWEFKKFMNHSENKIKNGN